MGWDTEDLGGGSNCERETGGRQGAGGGGGDEEHFRLDVPAEREKVLWRSQVIKGQSSKDKGQSQLTAQDDITGAEELKMLQ